VLKDVSLGLSFWLVSAIALAVLMRSLTTSRGLPESVLNILPRTPQELTLWLVVATSAGVCEEIVFRGYLQRQLVAASGRVGWGIVGQAVLFGIGHNYQGYVNVVSISLLGLALGGVAAWRKSLRPTMIWHAWMDAIGGVVVYLMRNAR